MKRRRPGFALMLVFLMAALVAVALYRELPRVAFEAQRSKEELLIERGEQYKRAIQLFFRHNQNRYPSKIEDLENFNNRRYLRKRYKDPMTGSDEWRIIRAGPGGVFLDSLTQKPAAGQTTKVGATVEEMAQQQPQGEQPVVRTRALGRIRPSERGMPPPQAQPPEGDPEQPPQLEANPPGQPPQQEGENLTQYPPAQGNPEQPGMQPPQDVPGQPGYPGFVQQPGIPGQPGMQPPTGMQPGVQPPTGMQQGQAAIMPGQPGWQPPNQPVVLQPGQPGFQPGQPVVLQPGQPGFQSGQPVVLQPGQPGFQSGQPDAQPPQVNPYQPAQVNPYQPPPQMPPQQMPPQQPPVSPFGNQPRLQPVPAQVTGQIYGLNQPPGNPGMGRGNMTIGGGIAGFASKSEDEGIKLYNERSKYKEWEFIYDPRKDNTNALSSMGRVPGQNVNPSLSTTKAEDKKSDSLFNPPGRKDR